MRTLAICHPPSLLKCSPEGEGVFPSQRRDIKIEAGTNTNPTIETSAKIAKALGVGVDDLIKK